MNEKKRAGIFGLILFGLIIFSLVGVIAIDANGDGYDDATGQYLGIGPMTNSNTQAVVASINRFADGFVSFMNPIARYILGDTQALTFGGENFSAGAILFAKVLFFVIILAVVWKAMEKIPFFSDQDWVLWLVSISVAILSTRFLGNSLVPTMLLPYSALGVTLSAAIPFVVYFLLINVGLEDDKYKSIRRTAWIFFGVIFIGLWFTYGLNKEVNFSWIYPATAVGAVIMALIDGTIHGFFTKIKNEEFASKHKKDRIRHLQKHLKELLELKNDDIITQQEYDKERKETWNEIRAEQKRGI